MYSEKRGRLYLQKRSKEELIMDKLEPDLHFKLMALAFKLRDIFAPRRNILKEAGIKPGFHVLDYGCGSGSYIADTAELVGKSGWIYALDIHPLAIESVQRRSSEKRLLNVETIQSDCKTSLPDNCIDAVLLYDVFHKLSDPGGVLEELHRVLKPDGILSVSDHHLSEDELVSGVTDNRFFMRSGKGRKTHSFSIV